ncbi:ATP-binding protein [Trinickia dinghuensis]|nr:ATP-binding protein [Trinickia dinghuensis]
MTDTAARPYPDNAALLEEGRDFIDLVLECGSVHDERASRAWRQIVARMTETLQAGIFLSWIHVAVVFRLSALDQQLLWLALIVESDDVYRQRVESLFAGDDENSPEPTRTASAEQAQPRVSLRAARSLLGDIQSRFLPDAPLLSNFLIDTSQLNLAAMAGSYRLSPPLVPYLMAIAAPQATMDDVTLPDIVEDCDLRDHLIDERTKRQLMRFIDVCGAIQTSPARVVLYLQGSDAVLLDSLGAATFGQLGYTVAKLDARLLRRTYERADARRSTLVASLRLLCRDALLCNQVLALANIDVLRGEKFEGDVRDDIVETVLHTILEAHRYLLVVNAAPGHPGTAPLRLDLPDVMSFRIRIEAPGADLRRQAWLKHAARFELQLGEEVLNQLANDFSFSEGQIANVVRDASSARMLSETPGATTDIIIEACREEAEAEQPGVATVLRWSYRMDDLVVPSRTREVLDELMNHIKYRHRVVEEWGFGDKYAGTRNLSALFYGPPGTGKTMAAMAVANGARRSLYRVDLAKLFNKYIGETEKQLARLFDRANDAGYILFFDEAESLFQKRNGGGGGGGDTADRFLNVQVGYMLQRLETYPGPVILATNLRGNIDLAMYRRTRFFVEFPFPAPAERKALWLNAFPPPTPLANDIDFDRLAEKAVLAGGSIQTVALSAAFRAAAEGGAVSMHHIARSIELEYGKLGKLVTEGEFG